MERITVWMARVGFLSIAACTFGLSFDAIRDVAQNTGAVDPSLAWIVPLAVDGMIVTATAVLWTESLSGRGWHLFPLAAIIGPAALSMWANVAHASGTTLLAQVLAAVPPAGLILSLELVSWQIRRERTTAPRFTPAWVDRRRRDAARAGAAAADGGQVDRRRRYVGPVDHDGNPPDDVAVDVVAHDAVPHDGEGVAARSDHRTGGQADAGPADGAPERPDVDEHGRAGGGGRNLIYVDDEWRDAPASPSAGGQAGAGDPLRTPPATDRSRVPAGQLQIDRDDTGRLTLDLPPERRSKEVWTQIIQAVQESGEVPTQRQLAAELNVPRSRVRRAIERNRDQWEELVGRVDADDREIPVTSGAGSEAG